MPTAQVAQGGSRHSGRISAEQVVGGAGCHQSGDQLAAQTKLKLYDWPGNIRELQNALKKAVIFNRGAPLQPEEISLAEPEFGRVGGGQHSPGRAEDIRPWIRAMLRAEKKDRMFDSCLDQVAALLLDEALRSHRRQSIPGGKAAGHFPADPARQA